MANQWPTLLQDNALRASILWESEWKWAPWACSQPFRLPQKPAAVSTACLKGVSALDLLTLGKPVGRAVRLLQKMEASEVANHGN